MKTINILPEESFNLVVRKNGEVYADVILSNPVHEIKRNRDGYSTITFHSAPNLDTQAAEPLRKCSLELLTNIRSSVEARMGKLIQLRDRIRSMSAVYIMEHSLELIRAEAAIQELEMISNFFKSNS
jgi:hypothetical protein